MLFFFQRVHTLCLEGDLRGSSLDTSFRVCEFQAHFWKHILAVIMDEVNELLLASRGSLRHVTPWRPVTLGEIQTEISSAPFLCFTKPLKHIPQLTVVETLSNGLIFLFLLLKGKIYIYIKF